MKRLLIILLLIFSLLAAGCRVTTAAPARSCEQQFNDALNAGVSYVDAFGEYTQCLIDEGRVVDVALFLLEHLIDQIGNRTWQRSYFLMSRL